MEAITFSHTHWDREWYKPFQDFRIRLCEVIDLIIDELVNGQSDFFYLDGQAIILEDYLEIHPQKSGQIKNLINNKKLFIGPWYVLADEFLVSGESLVRNLLIGINQAREYGCDSFFGYLPDSFGHNSKMPVILSSFNIKRAVLWRGAGDKKSEFIWETEDGTSVIVTYLIQGYFQDLLHSKLPMKDKTGKIKEILDDLKKSAISDKILFPAGGDHLGPVINLKGAIKEINSEIKDYKIKQGSINEYFNSLNLPEQKLQTVKGELRDNSQNPVLPGTLSSRMYLKQMNAKSTWLLSRIAEPLHSFLKSYGLIKNKKAELAYAWKLLLKNHPHDSICGCSLDEAHEENVSGYKQVEQISRAITDRCIAGVAKKFQEKDFFICNLSNYNYSGVTSIKTTGELPKPLQFQFVGSSFEFPREILLDTQKAPFCEDIREFKEYLVYAKNIPPFSLNPLIITDPSDIVEVYNDKIRNSSIEITVNQNGSLNLKDFKTDKVFKNLHILLDRADIGDTYNYAPPANDKPVHARLLKTEITEKGPLRGKLTLFYSIKIPKYFDYNTNSGSEDCHESVFSTEIIISSGSKRVEFVTSWQNNSKNHITQIKFNFPEKITKTVSEDSFGLIEREFNPDYRIEDHIPAEKGKELMTNSAPMQRFVFAQGLGIITEGLSEYIASGNSLYITLLRATGKLSATSLNTRNFPAGPPLDVSEAQCLGSHSARYAICPAVNVQELFREADEFMGNVITGEGLGSSGEKPAFSVNLLKTGNQNIIVYGVKIPENNEHDGIIVRLFNLSGKPESTGFSSEIEFSGFFEVNSLEEKISDKIKMRDAVIFRPAELKTFLFLK